MSAMPSNDYNRDDRVRFLGIDAESRATLAAFNPVLERELPAIVDGFYEHIMQWPELRGMFPSERIRLHARDAQLAHWMNLYSGRFDQSYVESVRRIGLTHARIGLEPRWYIGGYAHTLGKLYAAAVRQFASRWRPEEAQRQAAQLLRALNQAAMLDMDFAISIYLEEKDRKANALIAMSQEFAGSVRAAVESVAAASAQLKGNAQGMNSTADATSQKSVAVATAAEQAAANVQTVATATEELSSSITEIGRQVVHSSRITGDAVEEARRTDATVQRLSEMAQRIGDVVKLISDIASQTNLLALNATIEAARAGDAGKGFAVVASEVKTLANQTAKATDEIAAQISAMQSATGDAVTAIRTIGKVIAEVNSIASSIAAAVEEQGAATQEIAKNIQQAAGGTNEVTANIAQVQEGAAATGQGAADVLRASQNLATQSEGLRGAVDAYVQRMEAA